MKNFSEMTANEFSYAKQLSRQGKFDIVQPSFSGKTFTDFSLSENYYADAITTLRISDDFYKNYRDRYLSNREIKDKVKMQLKLEKEKKEQWVIVMNWQFLLGTKLFNNTKI